jgi:hypothetical protein
MMGICFDLLHHIALELLEKRGIGTHYPENLIRNIF